MIKRSHPNPPCSNTSIPARRLGVIAIFLALLPLLGCTSPPQEALVTRVIDGDTIVIEGGYRVRYIGIDTPETYPEAEAFGAELVRSGLAEAEAYPPDIKYQDYLESLEEDARNAGRGIWAEP